MKLTERVVKTGILIVRCLSRRGCPVYHDDLFKNELVYLSVEGNEKRFSDSLGFLEERGLIKEIGTDAYSL